MRSNSVAVNSYEPASPPWRRSVGTSAGSVSVGGSCSYSRSYPVRRSRPMNQKTSQMTRSAGIVASARATRPVRIGMRLQRVDAVAVGLVALGVGPLLLDDPVEGVPALDPHAGRRRERASRDQRAELDELLGRDVHRSERRAGPDELDVAAHPHRLAPRAQDLPRCRLDPDEPVERLLPLVAPDLEVDVHHVVVRDRDAAERVRDRERPRLVACVEVPDDPHRVAAPLDSEGPGLAGIEARLASPTERSAALRDRRVDERLSLAERDVAVAEEEVARERDLEALADAERAVRLDVDGDVGLQQREAVGAPRGGAQRRRRRDASLPRTRERRGRGSGREPQKSTSVPPAVPRPRPRRTRGSRSRTGPRRRGRGTSAPCCCT